LDREFADDILLFAIPSDEAAQMVDRGACSNKLVAKGLTSSECSKTLILTTQTQPGKTMNNSTRSGHGNELTFNFFLKVSAARARRWRAGQAWPDLTMEVRCVVGVPSVICWKDPRHEILHIWIQHVPEIVKASEIKTWAENCTSQNWKFCLLHHWKFAYLIEQACLFGFAAEII